MLCALCRVLYAEDGHKRIADNTLVALTLMIAESRTEEKDVMGLWGGISGFIAVDADNNTIYGVYFNHEGELEFCHNPFSKPPEGMENGLWQNSSSPDSSPISYMGKSTIQQMAYCSSSK